MPRATRKSNFSQLVAMNQPPREWIYGKHFDDDTPNG
jgi:hypothetical protein